MPRGTHPHSRLNLKKGKPFDEETARKANKKSHETKAILKSFRELDAEDPNTPQDRTEMLAMLKRMAKRGNLHAFQLYRDTVGLKPTDKMEVTGDISFSEILKQAQERENMVIDDSID